MPWLFPTGSVLAAAITSANDIQHSSHVYGCCVGLHGVTYLVAPTFCDERTSVSEKFKFVFIRQPKSSSTAFIYGLAAVSSFNSFDA